MTMTGVGAANGYRNGACVAEAGYDHRPPGGDKGPPPYTRFYAHSGGAVSGGGGGRGKEFKSVYTPTEVASALAVDHGRVGVLGGISSDWQLFIAWGQSGRANRDLSKAFAVSGVLVMLAHISAFAWALIWEGTARLMGVQ